MKKILLAIGAMLLSLNMAAQGFIFCDKNGTEIKDGSTLTMNEIEEDFFGTKQITLKDLYIKNTGSAEQKCSVDISVKDMSNGSFSTCCFGSCITVATGKTVNKTKSMKAGESVEVETTEWIPTAYGTCTATFKLATSVVTVNFVYADPAAIKTVTADNTSMTRKCIKNGRVVIINGTNEYTAAGALLK